MPGLAPHESVSSLRSRNMSSFSKVIIFNWSAFHKLTSMYPRSGFYMNQESSLVWIEILFFFFFA